MFRKKANNVEDMIAKTYEWKGLILPIIAGRGKRFIAVDTHDYPWRYLIIDTKHNVEVSGSRHMYDILAIPEVKSLNEFAADGCTFPWEPKNV